MKSTKMFIIVTILLFAVTILFASEYGIARHPYDIKISDIDCDGDIDIIVASALSTNIIDTISIFYNDAIGNFTTSYIEKENLHFLLCAKIDNDEYPDLVTKNPPDCVYFHNNGDGTFTNSITIHSIEAHVVPKIIDIDNDNSNDIVFFKHNPYGYWGVWHNNGYGEFTEEICYPTDANIMHLDAGKIDADEYPDVAITISSSDSFVKIFYNNITYFTEEILNTRPWSHNYIEDINNDGLNDIFYFSHSTFSEYPSDYMTAYNIGNHEFVYGDTLDLLPGALILNINDLNNDGYPDIVFYRNTWENPGSDPNIYVSMNNHNGNFSQYNTYYIDDSAYIFRVASADFDGNNYPDLAIIGQHMHNLRILFNDGTGNFVEEPQVGINNDELQITNYKLNNYPNPFNPETTISYTIPQNTKKANIEIYNLKGEKVKSYNLPSTANRQPSTITWNGKNDDNKTVPSGVYFYKLSVNGKSKAIKKCLLLK